MTSKIFISVIFFFLTNFSFPQAINFKLLFKNKIQLAKVYTIDSSNSRQLKSIIKIDLENHVITRLDIDKRNGEIDTSHEITKLNSEFIILSSETKSKHRYSLITYTYPYGDTLHVKAYGKNELYREDSLGNIRLVHSDNSNTFWETKVVNKKTILLLSNDETPRIAEKTTEVKNNKTIITWKYFDRKKHTYKPVKEVYTNDGDNISYIAYYKPPKNSNSCKVFTVDEKREFNSDGTINKAIIIGDFCGKTTEKYEYEYFK